MPNCPTPIADLPAPSSGEEEKTSIGEEAGSSSSDETRETSAVKTSDSGSDSKEEGDSPTRSPNSESIDIALKILRLKIKRAFKSPITSAMEVEKTSSSEEEEGSGSSSSEELQDTSAAKNSDSDSDSGYESEEEDDSSVETVVAKSMDDYPLKLLKSKSSLKSSAAASSKRASQVDPNPRASKRAKTKGSGNKFAAEKSGDAQKLLFQRLWSKKDEVNLLKGIFEFSEKNGVDPSNDLPSFFELIKKSVHFPVSLVQLKNKINSLKRKFKKHASGRQGEDKTFSKRKSHDHKLFDLSKKIWGALGGVKRSNLVKSKSKAKKTVNRIGGCKSLAELERDSSVDEKESAKAVKKDVGKESGSGFMVTASAGGMEKYVLQKGLEMLDDVKRAELEGKWRKLHVAEQELYVKRNELIGEQAKLMLAGWKNK